MDRLAFLYDLQLPLERRAIDAALDLLAPERRDRVLDLGTGSGAVLAALGRRSGRPVDVVGLDSSRRMLDRVPELPVGWRLVEADATRIPLPDRGATAVTAVYLLHLLESGERDRAVAEIARVLEPGGRVVVVTPVVPRGALAGPYRAAVASLRTLGRTSLGLAPLDPRSTLTRHGLQPVRARYVPRGYPTLCVLAHRRGRESVGETAGAP